MRLRVGRMMAYARNETMQILRDRVRLAFAFVGSALLMLVFGFGITTDVAFEQLRRASQNLNIKLRDVADHVTRTGQLPTTPAQPPPH